MEGRNKKGQFAYGHKESKEEKAVRLKNMQEALVARRNDLGGMIATGSQLYKLWKSFYCSRHKSHASLCEEWKDFQKFYQDVLPTYRPGAAFERPDETKVFSKDNFVWVEKEGAGYDLDERWMAKQKAKRARYARPETIRKRASKMISQYRKRDKKDGTSICDIDVDWMVENIIKKPCVYCGDTNRIGCDRIDNSKGHTKDNVVPCCFGCNTARSDNFSYEEMKTLGRVIAEIKAERAKK